MQVAVYDTYVLKPGGSTAHFDIIVPKETTSEQALAFGKIYLSSSVPEGHISTRECQFCHIETPGPEVVADIEKQGYYILEFDDIPAKLPAEPSRRQLIEHIRARSEAHRFASFQGVGVEKLQEIIQGF